MAVEYRLLGPLEALVDGRPAVLGGPLPRAVLVCLLTQPNAVVPATRLIDALWPESPPSSAANLVQGHVSQLRKALGREVIETRGAGYALHVDGDALDLVRFERLAHAGSVALTEGRAEDAAGALREAVALWRGPPLADLDGEPAVDGAIARLEELRLLARERWLEAELACGRHADVLADVEALVRERPLRERPHELRMLALYRSGRQAEALDAYRAARSALVEQLGIEPGAALQQLHQAILRQDAALAPAAVSPPAAVGRSRSILVTPLQEGGEAGLVALAEPLARRPGHEVVLAATVTNGGALGAASARLHEQRARLQEHGISARAAVFTSVTPGADLARLATEHDVDLLLADAPDGLLEDARVLALLEQAPCDVAIVVGGVAGDGPVFVPFAGAGHDWTAVELGAWLARAREVPLRLAGAASGGGGRDASRLLASASLAVQHALGVPAEPVLVEPDADSLLAAASGAGVVVVGLTERWRREGLGVARTMLATRAEAPVLLVRHGSRPGGLAPRGSETRYTWTLAGG